MSLKIEADFRILKEFSGDYPKGCTQSQEQYVNKRISELNIADELKCQLYCLSTKTPIYTAYFEDLKPHIQPSKIAWISGFFSNWVYGKEVFFQAREEFVSSVLQYNNFHKLGSELHDNLSQRNRDDFNKILERLPEERKVDLMKIADKFNGTLLHIALENSFEDLAENILNKMDPKDLGIQNSYGRTPLHIVLESPFISSTAFKALAKNILNKMDSKDLGIKDSNGNTPLHISLESGRNLVENILNKMDSKDLGVQDSNENTPLHIVLNSRFIRYAAFKSLAENIINKMDPKDLSIQNSAGEIPLNIALENGYKDLAEKILNKMDPKDLGIQKSYEGTPLHLAIAKGFVDLAKKILNKMDSKDDLINEDGCFFVATAVLKALDLSDDLAETIIDMLPPKSLVNKYSRVFCGIILHGSENLAIKALEKIYPEDLTIKYRYPCELFSDKELLLYIAIDNKLINLAYKILDKMPKESCYPSDLKRCLELADEKGLDELAKKIVKKTC